MVNIIHHKNTSQNVFVPWDKSLPWVIFCTFSSSPCHACTLVTFFLLNLLFFPPSAVSPLTHTDLLSPSRTELVFSVTRELLSVPSASLSPPFFTPPNLLSLLSRYVDRQRLELLQDKLQWVSSTHTVTCGIWMSYFSWTSQHKGKSHCAEQAFTALSVFIWDNSYQCRLHVNHARANR